MDLKTAIRLIVEDNNRTDDVDGFTWEVRAEVTHRDVEFWLSDGLSSRMAEAYRTVLNASSDAVTAALR